jgi:hypothetical protein
MSQDRLIKIKSTGKKADGKASTTVIYTFRSKKKFTNKNHKLTLEKFDKATGKQEKFVESKK